MKSKDIEQGGTYMFVATDAPTRKHLEGTPFEVVSIKDVWRKLGRKRKVKRFFNESGDGARAEELEPMPEEGTNVVCSVCGWDGKKFELVLANIFDPNSKEYCPKCGATYK